MVLYYINIYPWRNVAALLCSKFTLRYAHVDVTSPAVYGSVAVITCHVGYRLPDLTRTRALICVDGGAWHAPPQDCLRTLTFAPCALHCTVYKLQAILLIK